MEPSPLELARLTLGWTREKLAEKVNVDPSSVQRWEHGQTRPRGYNLRQLCLVLNKTAEELGLQPAESDQDQLHQPRVTTSLQETQSIMLLPSRGTDEVAWTTWFGLKLASLLSIIEYYSGQREACLEFQETFDMELETMHIQSHDEDYIRSRRQTLVALAFLPTALLTSVIIGQRTTGKVEAFLTRCAASVTACWHLLRGSEISLIEEILSNYLPVLGHLALHPSPYQITAARLTTQGYRLKGIVALHRKDFKARDAYFSQAVRYSEIAQHPGFLVAALISLAYHQSSPIQATHFYQQGLLHEEVISPLQRSRLHVEQAVASAQANQEQEALRSLGLAQEGYPEHPERDPGFLYAEFHPASMSMEQGRVYLALAHHSPQRNYAHLAWKTFAAIEQQSSPFTTPPRILLEITNYQAETALLQRKVDVCSTYLEKGIIGARALGSEKRLEEASRIQKRAQRLWPGEPCIKALEDLLS